MASVHTRHQLLTRLTITKPEEDRSLEAVTRVATVASSCVAVASLLEAAFYFLYNRTVRIYNFCFKLIRQNNDNLESTTLFTCSFIHGWKSFRKLSQMRKAVKVDMFLLLLRWVHETFFTEDDSTPPNLSPTEVIEDDKTNPENDEKDNCNG